MTAGSSARREKRRFAIAGGGCYIIGMMTERFLVFRFIRLFRPASAVLLFAGVVLLSGGCKAFREAFDETPAESAARRERRAARERERRRRERESSVTLLSGLNETELKTLREARGEGSGEESEVFDFKPRRRRAPDYLEQLNETDREAELRRLRSAEEKEKTLEGQIFGR